MKKNLKKLLLSAILASMSASVLTGCDQLGSLPGFDKLNDKIGSLPGFDKLHDLFGGDKGNSSDSSSEDNSSNSSTADLPHEHYYGEPVWDWSEDFSEAKATVKCFDCGADAEELVIEATVVEDTNIVETCDGGAKVYTATVTLPNGETYSSTKSVSIAHTHNYDYENLVWNWSADMTQATATASCLTTSVTETAVVTVVDDGDVITYTATFEKDGKTYSDVKVHTHSYDTWDTSDKDYDYKACTCGKTTTDGAFKKSVTNARMEFYASTASTISVEPAGCSEYASVVSVKLGDVELGTDLSALDVTALKERKDLHGEKDLLITVATASGDEHVISVPVLIVTADIATAGELYLAIFPNNATEMNPEDAVADNDLFDHVVEKKYGYYRLTANIDYRPAEVQKEVPWAFFWTANPHAATPTYDGAVKAYEDGFAGTLDGQGFTIRSASTTVGTFNSLTGATIKNVTIEDWNYYGSNNWATLLAFTMTDTTLEDVNIKITYTTSSALAIEPGSDRGFLVAHTFTGNTLKNVTIDLAHSSAVKGLPLGALFGSGMDDTNTFEGCQLLNCGGMKEFGHNADTVYTSLEGFKAYVATSTVAAWNVGILVEDTEYQVSLTDDPATPIPEGMEIGDVYYNGQKIAHDNLLINPSAIFTTADLGSHTLTVEAIYNNCVYYTYTVEISIESAREVVNKTYQGAAKDLLLSQTGANANIQLSDIEEFNGLEIKGINYGTYSLGADASALVVSDELLAETSLHGEGKMITVIAESEEKIVTINIPVTIITKAITTEDEFNAVFTYPDAAAYYGYYTLANNIGWGGGSMWTFNAAGRGSNGGVEWRDYGFRGTFDGRGHTITGRQMNGGLFGWLGNGAVIKNFTVNDVYFTGGDASIFAYTMANTTVENVTVNFVPHSSAARLPSIPDTDQKATGWLVRTWAYGSTFKDVTLNAEGYEIYSLIGSGWYGGYEHTNTKAGVDTVESHNTYENLVINAKKLAYVGYWYENGTSSSDYGTFHGVTIIDEVSAGEGIVFSGEATITETTEIKLTEETATLNLGATYESAQVVSVKRGEDLIANDATFNTNVFTSADYGPITLTVVVKIESNNGLVTMTLSVPAVVSSGYTQATLAGARQDVILSEGPYSIDLGEYAGSTIESIATKDYNLGTDPANLDVAALKADPQKHGVQDIIVILTTSEGSKIELTVPVTIVTRAFSSAMDFQYRNTKTQTSWTGSNPFTMENSMFGYYILLGDIGYYNGGGDFEAIAYGNTNSTKPAGTYWTDSSLGFRGTFDGRGHTIAGLLYGSHGLFAGIGKDAVIKDTTFLLGQYDATATTVSVLANTINDATIENVTVRIHTMMKDAVAAGTANVGLLCFTGAYRNTFKNLQIISETAYDCAGVIGGIFGSGGYGFRVAGGNVFEGCHIKAINLLELGSLPALTSDPIVEVDAFANQGLTVTLTGANA